MKDRKLEMREGNIIEVPDGAVCRVDQELYDAGDPDSAFAVTVHEGDEMSACNFWQNIKGTWRRLLPERQLGRSASPLMLQGELMRFAQNDKLRNAANTDLRIKLGIMGLQNGVMILIEGLKDSD